MEATHNRMDPLDSREAHRVAGQVDNASMSTTSEHDESQITDVHEQGLIVDNERISLLTVVAECLVLRGHVTLEIRGAIHLTRDQDRSVEKSGEGEQPV